MRRVKLLCSVLMPLASHSMLAVSHSLLPEGSRLVGSAFTIVVPKSNTQPLESFAAQYGQGLNNMLEANLGAGVYLLHSGSTLIIPQQLVLPDTAREGIVISVAEVRLYYHPPSGNSMEVLPVGIGQARRGTLRNQVTTVERKQKGPTRVPTVNIRHEYAREDKTLPALVPSGPDSLMELYIICIGRPYVIHGTNADFGVGLRVDQGCTRLRNDDIKFLSDGVPVGTRVQLTDQPVRYIVESDGSRWLEVHEPLSHSRVEFESDRRVPLLVTLALREFTQGPGVSPSRARQTLQRRSGMPVNINAAAVQGSLQRGVQPDQRLL